jgi:NitT/TauT family transport system ATP-binding protein
MAVPEGGQLHGHVVGLKNACVKYRLANGELLEAVRDVSLVAQPGEFVSIIGPSGSGKTTLLEATIGLRQLTSGSIEVLGQQVRSVPDEVAIVFQEDSTFPWRTATDNVALGLHGQRMSKQQRRERAREILGLVGLSGFEGAYPRELSGGMKQRVAIARALIRQPRLLLLDEPFGALDEQTRLRLGSELLNMRRSIGSTVLMVTHSVQEAVLLSDTVVVLTSRPATVRTTMPITFDRERSADLIGTPEFAAYVGKLWDLLKPEGSGVTSDKGSSGNA